MKKSILKSIDSFKNNAIDCSNSIYGGLPTVLTKKYVGMSNTGNPGENTNTLVPDYTLTDDPDAS